MPHLGIEPTTLWPPDSWVCAQPLSYTGWAVPYILYTNILHFKNELFLSYWNENQKWPTFKILWLRYRIHFLIPGLGHVWTTNTSFFCAPGLWPAIWAVWAASEAPYSRPIPPGLFCGSAIPWDNPERGFHGHRHSGDLTSKMSLSAIHIAC